MKLLLKKIGVIICCGAIILVSACSPNSAGIGSKIYIGNYDEQSCKEIKSELVMVNANLQTASGQQDSRAKRDVTWTWITALFFFPALIFLVSENEPYMVAELKGQKETLERAKVVKC